MELLLLMLIPLPGEMALAVTPEDGVLLAETGALLVVDVGISQDTSGAENESWLPRKRTAAKERNTKGRLTNDLFAFPRKRSRCGIRYL